MKKITFLVSNIYKFGGVQKVNSTIVNELCKNQNKYHIEILSLFKTNNLEIIKLDKNIKVNYVINGQLDFKKHVLKIFYKIKKYFSNYNTDILVVSGVGLLPVVYTAILGKEIKIVAWDHQAFDIGKIFGFEWMGKRIASRFCCKTIVLTEQTLNDYKKNINSTNVVKIYNPIENNKRSNKKIYNIKSKKIITSGRIEEEKGFDILLKVAKRVFDKNPDWEWHIWGEGSKKKEIASRIKELSLEKNIKLCGYCDDLIEKYNEYSMYVMTSRHEGFGLVLIEAKVNKLPIVSFNCKVGPSEIIDNGKNGYLIECFNVNYMAEKINYLIENSNVRKEFSEKANLNMDKFNMNRIIDKWINIIDSI